MPNVCHLVFCLYVCMSAVRPTITTVSIQDSNRLYTLSAFHYREDVSPMVAGSSYLNSLFSTKSWFDQFLTAQVIPLHLLVYKFNFKRSCSGL